MSRRAWVVVVAALAGGCAHGAPPPAVVPEATRVGVAPSRDAALFDSLARAAQLPVGAPMSVFDAQTTRALAWIDVLRDTVLVRLVATALRDNRDIHAALGRIDEYRALVGVARSGLLPTVSANASASRNQIAIGDAPPISYSAWRVTGDLQWELDFWGHVRKGVVAAEADREAQEADESALVLTLVGDVADSYLELLEAREDLDVSERTLGSRQSTLGLARQRFGQGLISELDVRQFEADVAAAAVSVAQYTRTASEREHALSLLLGQAPGMLIGAYPLDSAVMAVSVPDSIPAALLLRRPDVQAAVHDVAAANARVGVAQAARLPQFLITGEYGTQAPTASQVFGADRTIYTAQAGISVPIFTGGRLSADVEVAKARADQARSRYEQVVLTALREAADALVGVRTDRDQLAAEAAQAAALRDAYRLAGRRYEGGIASYLEVLEAQRGLFAAELALTQGRRVYLEAAVQLYRALGGKWETAGR